jgi:hypothetical protein
VRAAPVRRRYRAARAHRAIQPGRKDPVLGAGSENWIDRRIDPRDRGVPNVVDLTLVSNARRILRTVLDERGLGFFLLASSRAPKLDPRRIAWVVSAARRQASRRGRKDPDALSRTRRVIRKELIRRLSEAMLQAGL